MELYYLINSIVCSAANFVTHTISHIKPSNKTTPKNSPVCVTGVGIALLDAFKIIK